MLTVLTNEMIERFKLGDWIKFLFFKWLGFKDTKRIQMLGLVLRNLPYGNISASFIKEHILEAKIKIKNRDIEIYPDDKRLLYSIIWIKTNNIIVDDERIESFPGELREAYRLAYKSKYTSFFEEELGITPTEQEYEDVKKVLDDHFSSTQVDAVIKKEKSKDELMVKKINTPLKYVSEKYFIFEDVLTKNEQRVKNFAFNPYEKKISDIAYIPDLRKGSASIIIDKKIFLVNGFGDPKAKSTYTDYVCSYDITKNAWDTNIFGTQTVRRCNSTMVRVPNNDKQAYQIGGMCKDDESAIDIKLYDFEKLSISTSCDISNYSLFNIQNGIFLDKAYYLFEHQSKYNTMSKIVRWDPRESFSDASISEFSYINSTKPNYALASYQNCVFILGGQTTLGSAKSDVVVFDVRNLKTLHIEPMPFKRYNHSCFVYKEDLYVLGGIVDGEENDTTIDIFDIKNFKWSISATKIPFSLNYFTGVYYT
uniref:Kelch motif family protein n=1 Tax=Strongyloides papillosus TaxID=174720 RepID=A0A0N5B773_STREA